MCKRDRPGVDRFPVATSLGGYPAVMWSGSAPLPPDIDEFLLAGWLRGKPVELVRCVTQPLEVPAEAEIVIEGYVDPTEKRPEGPFGDHTGYYTPGDNYPCLLYTSDAADERSRGDLGGRRIIKKKEKKKKNMYIIQRERTKRGRYRR